MKTMTQAAFTAALISKQKVETPVQIKTDWTFQSKYGRITVLSTILEYDEYVGSMVYKDTAFLYKGRLNLLRTMIPVSESLDSAIKRQISRQDYYNRKIAVA